MLTQGQRDELSARVERVQVEVMESVIEEMYRNPFWQQRYGQRGEKQSNKDAAYNLKYLCSAIRMDTTSALEQYYRWLRGALVFRGMCTLHLAQTLDCTARHLTRLLPEDWPEIEPYHVAGCQGLTYQQPTAHALNAHADEIAETATARMFDPPHTGDPAHETARRACLRDNLYHLAYLADAFEVNKPELFREYLAWVTGFLAQFDVQASSLYGSLKIIRNEIGAVLPNEHSAPVIQLMTALLTKKT
jgi:hypothetical protein